MGSYEQNGPTSDCTSKKNKSKILDLGNCGIIGRVPSEIRELTTLKELYLGEDWVDWRNGARFHAETVNRGIPNQISFLPLEMPQNLEVLVASGTGINYLEKLSLCVHLKKLLLAGTNIYDLSPLQELKNLEILDLGYATQVSNILPIRDLRKLRTLILKETKVEDISAFSNLTNLRYVDLESTQVRNLLPLHRLKNLEYLKLGRTQVSDISYFTGLVNLKWLDLERTQIKDISPLKGLLRLNALFLNWTNVSDLSPIQSLLLKGLEPKFEAINYQEGIILQACPLVNPPKEIAYQGREAILSYWGRLGAHEVAGPKPLNEAKIIMIGDGAAGKSSLLSRLHQEPFDPNRSQTHGIQIRKEIWRIDDQDMLLRFWDFGGQEIMHATHRFFLTRRAVYLIVLDSRKEKDDSQVEYWLEHVRVYGGDAKVVIVINKVDENASFAINEKAIRERHGDRIQGVFRVSCLNGSGVVEVEARLRELIAADEATRIPLPPAWRRLKDAVEEMDADYLSLKGFQALCETQEIVDESEQNTLLGLFHNLGIALHFPELNGHDTAVLNPEWLTLAVYRVINSELAALQAGEFLVADIPRFLHDPKYLEVLPAERYPANKHPFIVEAMAAFELCYRLPELVGGQRKYLIPELLPVAENTGDLDAEGCACLELHYSRFLPLSVLPRFIVQMHPWVIHDQAWRAGACLSHTGWGAQAIVRLDRQARRIAVQVMGQARRQMMEFIRDTFRGLHETFQDLEVAELVPLDMGAAYVDYVSLKGHDEDRIEQYYSGKLRKRFSVADLLNGLEAPERRLPPYPPVRIFVSFSPKEASHKSNLLTHLSVYTRSGKATVWDEGKILAGEVWKKELWRQHAEADIVVCLMSAAFVDSEYCYDTQFLEAVKSAEEGRKNVVPVLVEPFHFAALEPISALSMVCADRAVGVYKNDNIAWTRVMEALAPIIDSWVERKRGSFLRGGRYE